MPPLFVVCQRGGVAAALHITPNRRSRVSGGGRREIPFRRSAQ